MVLRLLGGLLLLAVIVLIAFVVFAWEREIEPIEPWAESAPGMVFKPELVARGERLALLGNCITCHTAPGGRSFAGGLAMQTPFGTLYSTNITPDPQTGIGRWSREAFLRSMREGVDRRGRHLYPAFPYEHFRVMSDEDIDAVYAYLMTRPAVEAKAPENDLPFPLNIRMMVAGWKGLFLEERTLQPEAGRSAEWNRGAYLVQGVAHCSACHTPRNFLGAEKDRQFLAGGEASGWHAPALTAASPAPVPWTIERLYSYLRFGMDDAHAVPAGPMQPVVQNLAHVPEDDVRAMATYVASLNDRPAAEVEKQAAAAIASAKQKSESALQAVKADLKPNGAAIYATACASCHALGRDTPGGALHLALGTALHVPVPDNLIHIIRQGIAPPPGETGPWMPGYAGALNEAQTVALVEYLRSFFAGKPAWRNVAEKVRESMEADR